MHIYINKFTSIIIDMESDYQPKYINRVSQDSAEINLFDEIGNGGISGQEFADDIQTLNDFGVKEIHININSGGGSVIDGLSIFSAIQNSKATIHTNIVGIAASMAGVIAMAGDKITMVNFGKLMIHNPHGSDDPSDNEKKALNALRDSLITIFKNRTKKSKTELSSIMDEETWLTPQQALEGGFIDEIVDNRHNDKKKKRQHVAEIANILDININNGSKLFGLLNRTIESKVTDSKSRADIIDDMASEAGISASTVGQILRGDINCPPIRRLEAFGKALDISASRIITAAEGDGCQYNVEGDNINCALTPHVREKIVINNKLNTMKKLAKYFNLNEDASEDAILEAIEAQGTKLETANTDLETKTGELETATDKVTELEATVKEYTDAAEKLNDELIEEGVDEMVTAGQIEEKDKEAMVDQFKGNLDGLKLVKNTIKGKATMISTMLKPATASASLPEKLKGLTFRELEKEHPQQLANMKEKDLDSYKALYKEEYNVEFTY